MSALTLPQIWAATAPTREAKRATAITEEPLQSYAFYRGHTERMLRRYAYAAIQVGRSPSVLNNVVLRGRASSMRLRNFEDAVIFVLDMENCLKRLTALDQSILTKIAIQEYTQAEAAQILNMCTRTAAKKYGEALDHLTELLMKAELLDIPQ